MVPELAARSHIEKIDMIAKKAIEKSRIKIEEIDAVAATAGPGLIVCLSVGYDESENEIVNVHNNETSAFFEIKHKGDEETVKVKLEDCLSMNAII